MDKDVNLSQEDRVSMFWANTAGGFGGLGH